MKTNRVKTTKPSKRETPRVREARRPKLLDLVIDFYLGSRDFNGMPAALLAADAGPRWKSTVRRLVEKKRLEILTGQFACNPHIKRLQPPSVEEQLRALDAAEELAQVCMYPHPAELEHRVDRAAFAGRPFTLALALGAPQLAHRGFDLRVLETYRNDPRYTYDCDDLHGAISVSDEHYRSDKMPEHDKGLLPTFGFGYDEAFKRTVVTFNCYLADLTPEHQRIWAAHEVASPVKIHPDFYRTQIVGDFPEELPVCQAFFMELEVINEMSAAMGRPKLFRNVERPKRFGFLLRPTQHEFEQFVQLLDKTLSDNLNQKFFRDEVTFEHERPRSDGKVQVERKGTLQALEDWIDLKMRMPDRTPFEKMMGVLREVRKLRQAPAHAVTDDVFDQEIFHKQRSLLVRAYTAVRTLRLMLANHPASSSVAVDPFLYAAKINTL